MKTLIAASALALTMGTTSQANELDDLLLGLDNTKVSFTGEIGYVRGMSTQIYISTEAMSRTIYGQVVLKPLTLCINPRMPISGKEMHSRHKSRVNLLRGANRSSCF